MYGRCVWYLVSVVIYVCNSNAFEPTTCPTLVPGAHQLLSAADAYVGDAAVIVICEPGYILSTGALQQSLLCQDVNSVPSWNGPAGNCVRKACPSLVVGNFMTASSDVDYYGDKANVTCNVGYAFDVDLTAAARVTSVVTLTCNDDAASTTGVWSDAVGTCADIDCGPPPYVSNSYQVYTNTSYGSDVLYQCYSGHGFTTRSFLSSVTCNATAHWESYLGPDLEFDDDIYCGGLQRWLGCVGNGSLVVENATAATGVNGCYSNCKASNYRLSAINGDTCYCGNALLDGYYVAMDEECNMTCSNYDPSNNDEEPFCGGPGGLISLFVSLDGCFEGADLAMYDVEEVEDERAVTCRERCRANDTSHAALTMNMCYCFNDTVIDYVDEIGAAYCDNNNTDHVRIYDLAKRPRLATTCDELYGKGIRMNGPYYLIGQVNKTDCYFKDGTQCDTGWVGYGGNCYYFHTHDTMNFTAARNFCLSKDAGLVSITTEEEYQFLHITRTVFSDLIEATSVCSSWYLGLVDSHDTSLFSWLDGNLLSYTAFRKSEPNNNNHDCAADFPDDHGALWQDAQCGLERNVMCKRAIYDGGCASFGYLPATLSHTDTEMTLVKCLQLCRGVGGVYSIVRGEQCGCLNGLASHTRLPRTDCAVECPGDPSQYCAGAGGLTTAITAKAIEGRLPAKSCEELQLTGIGNGSFQVKPDTFIMTQFCGAPECPYSWVKINGNCYKFNTNKMTAKDAQLACYKYDAYPVVIETIRELDLLTTTINKISIFASQNTWRIGVESLYLSGGLYRWANGRIFDVAPLNNTFLQHEGLHMLINTSEPSSWRPTSVQKYAFICEQGKEYMGCYNSSGIQYTYNISGYDQMTIQQCIEYCRNYGESYAYLGPTDCKCSSALTSQVTNGAECTTACEGQENQLCGGVGVMSVYNVTEYQPFATTCADLFDGGIFLSSNYIVNGTSMECHLKDGTICDSGWVGYNGDCYTYLPMENLDVGVFMVARPASLTTVQEYRFLVDYLKRRYFNNNKQNLKIYSGVRDTYELAAFMNADGSLFDPNIVTDGYIDEFNIGLERPYLSFDLANGLKLDNNAGVDIGALYKADKANRGCFIKPTNIAPVLVTVNWMETTLCKQLCLGQSKSLALIGSNVCMCVESPDVANFTATDSPDCYVQCNTFGGGYCGQGDVVWALDIDADDVATDCNNLYMAGVLHNSTYKLWNGTDYRFETCGFADSTICPATWLGRDGNCFKFLVYTKTFTDAVADCFSRDGYLFNPTNSTSVNAFVADTLASLPSFAVYQRFQTGIMVENYNTSFVTSDGHLIYGYFSTNNMTMLPLDTVVYQIGRVPVWTKAMDNEAMPYVCQTNQDYLGCNSISSPSDANTEVTDGFSVTFCLEYCRGQDAAYAATSTSACSCYVTLPTMTSALGQCMTSCDGVASQPCGGLDQEGGRLFSVFKIPTSRHVPYSCEELLRYGVGTPGWYNIQPPGSSEIKVFCFDKDPPLSAIPASQIKSVTASSNKAGYAAVNAIYTFPRTGVWKPKLDTVGEFVKIVTSDDVIVTGLQIFGLHSPSEQSWVSEIGMSYREKVTGSVYVYGSNVNGGHMNASTNGIDGANIIFQDPFVTNELFIYPKIWSSSISMSIRIFGQKFTSFDHDMLYVGCYAEYGAPYTSAVNLSAVELCMDHCRSSDYAYASLDVSGQCTCLHTGLPDGRLEASSCPTVDGWRRGQSPALALYMTFEKRCPAPPTNFTSGAVSATTYPYIDDVYTYGTSITYACDDGYEFNDVSTELVITCQQTNQWQAFNMTCDPISCPTFTVANGNTVITSPLYQGEAVVTCDAGFFAENSARQMAVRCEASKNWTITPTCKVENFKNTQKRFQKVGDVSRATAVMLDEHVTRSLSDCAAKCTQVYDCRGANYQTPGTQATLGTCRLFSDVSDGSDLTEDGDWKYFESAMPP